ncbi:hypothetical protein WT73_27900 [Burkholderia stagnalis]|nr:hypothetical protein WT73_27900 [Burkholderia stagnalis]
MRHCTQSPCSDQQFRCDTRDRWKGLANGGKCFAVLDLLQCFGRSDAFDADRYLRGLFFKIGKNDR